MATTLKRSPAKTRTRNTAIAIFPTFGSPVRVYGPTKSLPYYSATFYTPGIPRQQRTTLGTDEQEALNWGKAKAESLKSVQHLPQPERPFASFAALVRAFLDVESNGKAWKERTAEKYGEHARRLPQWLLELECRHVDEEALQRTLTEFAGGRARSYVTTHRSLIVNVVNFGRRRGFLLPGQLSNLVLTVPREDDEEENDDAVDRDALPVVKVLGRLVKAIREPMYQLMVRIALTSGMRFSELAGLHWSNVDLERGKIRVVQAVSESNRGTKRLVSTKNRRRRTTIFALADRDALAARVKAAKEEEARGGTGMVFPAPRGGLLGRNNFGKRVWRPAIETILDWDPSWHFHTLRHCAAVAMFDDLGLKVTEVSRLLGHRDVGVTERVYLNGRADASDNAAAALGWNDRTIKPGRQK